MMTALWNKIRREPLEMSNEQIADKLGCSSTTVSRARKDIPRLSKSQRIELHYRKAIADMQKEDIVINVKSLAARTGRSERGVYMAIERYRLGHLIEDKKIEDKNGWKNKSCTPKFTC